MTGRIARLVGELFDTVCPRGGGIFSLYLGFRKKTGPMYMGHYHIFFYSKANAPYFLGVGVSIDRRITLFWPDHSSRGIHIFEPFESFPGKDGDCLVHLPKCLIALKPKMQTT